jgi:hypothetical protein
MKEDEIGVQKAKTITSFHTLETITYYPTFFTNLKSSRR